MSWEVSSMPSKRSFFSPALFCKDLGRFWPLWGGVSLVGALFPLYLLLAIVQRQAVDFSTGVFAEGLYQIAAYFVPGFTCFYTILCAMAVWGYLYSARSVGLMHTLPVDRTCLFLTSTLAGLAMVLIPYAVTGALLCLIALGWGFFDLMAVAATVAAVLFNALLFFGMATLCAMLTGHAFVLPVFYLLANFLVFVLEALTTSLAKEFLLGIGMAGDFGMLGFLSPVVQIYHSFHPYFEHLPDGTLTLCRLDGLWVVALYALAGAAMLALAWLLYRRRHSESAGDVVAFRWLRPVFRYGAALLSALTIGRLLYELIWHPLFQPGMCADRIPMGVCIFLGGLVGYYIASMLLEKSLRVFRGSWRGVAAVAAGAAVLCLLVSVDVLGVERRVPSLEEIESVSLGDYNVSDMTFEAASQPELVEQVLAIHRAILADRDYIRSGDSLMRYQQGECVTRHLHLTYRLRDGSTVERAYYLWVTAERAAQADTYDGLLAAFYGDPAVRRSRVELPEGCLLSGVYVYNYALQDQELPGDVHLTLANGRRLYEALIRDADAGNIPGYDLLRQDEASYDVTIELEFRTARDAGYLLQYKTVTLSPSMEYTIGELKAQGQLTGEMLDQWDAALALLPSKMAGSIPADQVVLP